MRLTTQWIHLLLAVVPLTHPAFRLFTFALKIKKEKNSFERKLLSTVEPYC